MQFWDAGTEIVWRWRPLGEPSWAEPMTVVHDDASMLVAWLPAGTPITKLVRADGRDLRDDKTDMFIAPRIQVDGQWRHHSVLRVYRKGSNWSAWALFEPATQAFEGWYCNIEIPHKRVGRTTISRDCVLDLWVRPDRTFSRKDDDELALAVAQGRLTEAEAAGIERVAAEIQARIEAWSSPFCDGWEQFRPDPGWPLPQFPAQ